LLAPRASYQSKVILFHHSGHGHFDPAAYNDYLPGPLEDYEYPESKVKESLKNLPDVPSSI